MRSLILGLLGFGLICNGLLIFKIYRLQNTLNTCQLARVQLETANQIAKSEYDQYLLGLKNQKQIERKERTRIEKRMHAIMQEKIPGGCEGAISYLIRQAS